MKRHTAMPRINAHSRKDPARCVTYILLLLIAAVIVLQFILSAYIQNDHKILTSLSQHRLDLRRNLVLKIDTTNHVSSAIIGKAKLDIESMLRKTLNVTELSEDIKAHIPSNSEIISLYSDEPIILGLETCHNYRDSIPTERRHLAPAGTFNTGTNLLSALLHRNCHIPSPTRDDPSDTRVPGIRFQAPWGKHSPSSYRNVNVAKQGGEGIHQNDVLPVFTVKDPVTWMRSMCEHPYAVAWSHKKYCPHLMDEEGKPVKVSVKYARETKSYKNLLQLWIDFYHDWFFSQKFPRLFVRYEDLLFFPEETISAICSCAGGIPLHDDFVLKESSAKGEAGPHAGGTGILGALQKYGNETLRKEFLEGGHRNDLELVKETLQDEGRDLMNFFRYKMP